ncbi:MAG: DUF433 domain-containing protein [Cyanobacteria bacterium RI_101]|nr:DUF433 domain-containing protein [Cyanobacteria bacterium RI_101]
MTRTSKTQSAIIRTERGLTIAGTRITLYDVMDYLTAQYPPHFIQGLFNLTDEQIDGALAYIEERRVEVEAEYQIVLKEALEIQKYWEERNRERLAQIAKLPPPLGREAAWEKLQQHKARLQTQLNSQA